MVFDHKDTFKVLGIDLNKPVNTLSFKDLNIVIQGESEDFGGNDLILRAALYLIGSLNFKFQEEKDPIIREKTYIALIDRIGALIKADWDDSEQKMNIEAVKDFIDFFITEKMHEGREFKNLLDQEC